MASIIRITREFNFEMAHVLWNYDGPCKNVHGHSYRLFVTLTGAPLDKPGHPKDGMIIDFNDLKRTVNEVIIDTFDHAVVVSRQYGDEKINTFRSLFGNMILLDYQPTCENLVSDFAVRIDNNLPEEIKLHSLKLYETANSYAEWYATDNK